MINKDLSEFDEFCALSYKINTYAMFWAYLVVIKNAYSNSDNFKVLDNVDFSSYYDANHFSLGIVTSLLVLGLPESSITNVYKIIYKSVINTSNKFCGQKNECVNLVAYIMVIDSFQHSLHAIIELCAGVYHLNSYGLYKLWYHILHWNSLFVLGVFVNNKSEMLLRTGLKLYETAHQYEYLGHKYSPYCYHATH